MEENIPKDISKEKQDNLKDKIKTRRDRLQRILNGEEVEDDTDNPLDKFSDENPDEFNDKNDKRVPLPKVIPNQNNEKSDVEKEVTDSLDDLKKEDKTLLIGQDSEGNLIYDYNKTSKGNNKVAHLSREFEQSEEGGVVTRNENTNEIGNLHLLDPTRFVPGSPEANIVLSIDNEYDGEVYDPSSLTREKMLWSDRVDQIKEKYNEATYKESPEYIAEAPIKITTKGGEYIGYVHDTQWVREENIDNTTEEIQKDRETLQKIREIVLEKGKVDTKINYKSFGKLIKTKDGKSMSVSDAMPDANLVLAVGRNGEYNFSNNAQSADKANIINKKNPQDGRLYAIVQIGPEERIAIALERTTLDKKITNSILQAVEIYMNQDVNNPLVKEIIENTEFGLDITDINGIRKYLAQFVHLTQTDGALEDILLSTSLNESNVPLIAVTGNGIEFGMPGVNKDNTGKGKKAGSISHNYNKRNKKWNDDGLKRLEGILEKMLANADKESLLKGTSAVIINEDGKIETEYYTTYLKGAYQTKFISVNIGTDENPKYAYTIQPSITFDTSFAEGVKPGTSVPPMPDANRKSFANKSRREALLTKTNKELKKMLKDNGLPVSGSKGTMVQRLLDNTTTPVEPAALESTTQPTSEVEAKKADIKRRSEGAKLLIDEKELVKVTNQTGTKSTKEGIGKIVTFLNNTFADTYKLIEYDGKDLTLSRNGTEFKIPFTGVTLGGGSTRVYDFNINDIIDAKYDAELAALETQPS